MISTTTVHIQMQIQNKGGLCRFRYERFINFLTSIHGDTWRETQFLKVYANHTMLTPPQRVVHLVVFKISVGRDLQNLTTCLNDRRPKSHLNGPISTHIFFKILKFSGPFLPSMTSSIWGFIMTMVIVIYFAHERKLHQMTMCWN